MRWNLKEAGCQGAESWRTKFWADEQKSHTRPIGTDDSAKQEKVQYYPNPFSVNEAAIWNEGYRSYPGRAHRRQIGKPKDGVKLVVSSQQRS